MARNLSLPIIAKLDKAVLKDISEYDFQVAITKYAEEHSWKCQYFRKSAAMGKDGKWRGLGNAGWPDIVAVRDRTMVFLEVKAERGTLADEQKDWLGVLGNCGVLAQMVRPRDATTVMQWLD